MTNILLTGGAGYIGSHTAYALKKQGFTPIVLDSLINGDARFAAYGPLVWGDMGDAAAIRSVLEIYKPAAILHFAGFIEVAESVAQPDKYWDNNFAKAKVLFDTALACGIRHIVFSSTAAVYGLPQTDGLITEDHPLSPINPYGETKLAAETHLRSLDASGLRSVTLRYFNASGAAPAQENIGEAHDPETHLIPNIILAALGLREEVRLFGTDYPTPDGTAIRDYIHVLDLAEAHVAALRYLLAGGATEVCNLGTGQGSSVNQVVQAIETALGREIPKNYGPRRAGDPPRLVADANRARQLLGWEPKMTLADIVDSALTWHQSETYRNVIAKKRAATAI